MVPKLHRKGTSFRGAAAYLLHDKGSRKTKTRVEWTSTRNLATQRPELAWRVMAATALDSDRRKAASGIKATGRKSKDSVLHLTLAWHPDEAKNLTRKEMLTAADGALKALGAEDRQVLIVSHKDEPHPHVHLLINRVSAEDGRMLSSSNEKLALSKWAEAYEKTRRNIVCPERVENNARRLRGGFVRGKPDEARHLFEAKANALIAVLRRPAETKERVSAVLAGERIKDAKLATLEREMKSRHIAEWVAVKERHQKEKTTLKHKIKQLLPLYTLRIEKKYVGVRESFEEKQRKAFNTFARKEKTVLGRMSNRLSSIDFPALLKNKHRERQTLRDALKCITSSEARMQKFKQEQREERKVFEEKLKKIAIASKVKIFAGWRIRRVNLFESFGQQRFNLFKQQEQERATLAKLWTKRGVQRAAALEAVRQPEPEKHSRTSQKRQALTRDAARTPTNVNVITIAPAELSRGLSSFSFPPSARELVHPEAERTVGKRESGYATPEQEKPTPKPHLEQKVSPSRTDEPKPPLNRSGANRARFRGDDDDYGRERRR